MIYETRSLLDVLLLPKRLLDIRKDRLNASTRPFRKTTKISLTPSLGGSYKYTKNPQFFDDFQQLKIACVMDDFSYSVYAPEGNFYQLSPSSWRNEIYQHNPDMLFIESAWRGKDSLWAGKIRHLSSELADLIKYCRQRNIPTLFWNKEDPLHMDDFIETAQFFDYIFTTDINCIEAYKKRLSHDDIYLLPFSCQPKIHNPIEKYTRQNAMVFAGSYYRHYPERMKALDTFMLHLIPLIKIDIFDRNYGDDNIPFKFPDIYLPFIRGKLAYSEIDRAYKGYKYAINLNTIKDSSTMFARRIFELLASNTIIVSNFSQGVQAIFGDLVISTDDSTRLAGQLKSCMNNELKTKKKKLLALRKVMTEHTAEERLRYIVAKVFGCNFDSTLPQISVVGTVATNEQLLKLLDNFERQTYKKKSLLIVASPTIAIHDIGSNKISVLYADKDKSTKFVDLCNETSYISGMIGDDYYGDNYLLDLALATRYCDAHIIGKAAYYCLDEDKGELMLKNPEFSYHKVSSVAARSCILMQRKLASHSIVEWSTALIDTIYNEENILSIDEFNYCRKTAIGNFTQADRNIVCDLSDIDIGCSIDDIIFAAEKLS
ncbi:MAG: glycosyltransferase [Methyloprofundus sp.]|nr:glycosyltransferase [Methyloprofundus sp.]